jgi:hypothetical protein
MLFSTPYLNAPLPNAEDYKYYLLAYGFSAKRDRKKWSMWEMPVKCIGAISVET